YGFFSSPQRGSNKAGPGRRLRGPSLEVSMDAFDDLKCIVAERFEISVETLHAETDLVEDLGADSLDIVDLLMAVEERLGVSIDGGWTGSSASQSLRRRRPSRPPGSSSRTRSPTVWASSSGSGWVVCR